MDDAPGWGTALAGGRPLRGPLPSLALVHRLHPGDRDGVPLGDQVGRQRLRLRERDRPLGRKPVAAVVTVKSPSHAVQRVPADREGERARPGRMRGL